MIDQDLLDSLFRAVDTTAVADSGPSARAMTGAIRLRSAQPRICAAAFPVRTRGDIFPVARAVQAAPPGSVIVVDGGGLDIALSGELFARAALSRGLAGLVVDGGVRDVGFLRSCQLPVYSRHVTPTAGTAAALGELDVAVSCGGVTVNPGDVVLADQEGLLVLAPGEAERLLRAAGLVKDVEARAIRVLERGGSLADCLNVVEHEAALTAGRRSRLEFIDPR